MRKTFKQKLFYVIVFSLGAFLAYLIFKEKSPEPVSYATYDIPALSKQVMSVRSVDAYHDLAYTFIASGPNSFYEYLPYSLWMFETGGCGQLAGLDVIRAFVNSETNKVGGFSQETKRSLSFLFDDAVIMGYLDLSEFLNESSYEWELFHEKDSEFCDSLKEVYMSYYKKSYNHLLNEL